MPNNQNLVEVLCAIRFNPSQNEWDSTFFGKYDELVKKRGYTDRKEQKQVDFELDFTSGQNTVKKEQLRMVFSNPSINSAIIMADHFVSFHKLAPYDNWDKLIKEIAQPGLEDYHALGLGKGIIDVQCLYLNKYRIKNGDTLASLFNFLPSIKNSTEDQITFQGKYDIDLENIVQLKLNTANVNTEFKEAFFECSSFAKNSTASNQEFLTLAQRAHDNANNTYQAVIKL